MTDKKTFQQRIQESWDKAEPIRKRREAAKDRTFKRLAAKDIPSFVRDGRFTRGYGGYYPHVLYLERYYVCSSEVGAVWSGREERISEAYLEIGTYQDDSVEAEIIREPEILSLLTAEIMQERPRDNL